MVQNAIHTDPTEIGQLLSPQMIPYAVFLDRPAHPDHRADRYQISGVGEVLPASLKLMAIPLIVALAALYTNYDAIHRAGNISNKYVLLFARAGQPDFQQISVI